MKLAGPQLVQMFIGDGAKLVRDAFALAKERKPAIIFIDELDAIGTKRCEIKLSFAIIDLNYSFLILLDIFLLDCFYLRNTG